MSVSVWEGRWRNVSMGMHGSNQQWEIEQGNCASQEATKGRLHFENGLVQWWTRISTSGSSSSH